MSTVLPDIKSTNWQISTAGFGVIAEGLEDMRQCLDILLRTARGSDAFRPEFGSNIFQWVDAPVTVAIPNIKRAIIEAVEIWEKRVLIQSIKPYLEVSTLYFDVTYRLASQDIIDSLRISTDGVPAVASAPGSLILQAFYPPNPDGRPYQLALLFNNARAVPLPPSAGFSTLNGLFAWASDNLAYAGRWVQLVDRILLYLKPGYATTASIAIELLAGVYRYQSPLPLLQGVERYQVEFTHLVGGVNVTDLFFGQSNKDALLTSLRNDHGDVGQWSISPGTVDILGDFNAIEFSSDFDTGGEGYHLILLSSLAGASLIVTAASSD